jgi:hypothetical protein
MQAEGLTNLKTSANGVSGRTSTVRIHRDDQEIGSARREEGAGNKHRLVRRRRDWSEECARRPGRLGEGGLPVTL